MPIPHFTNPMGIKKKSGPSGSGTEDDPWLIYTSQQLYDMRNTTGYYKLANDIDLSFGYTGAPIWTSMTQNTGSSAQVLGLDGDDHKIYNLYSTRSGLFDIVGNFKPIIKNLTIEGEIIQAGSYNAGFFVGQLANYTGTNIQLINCMAKGIISSAGTNTGGLIGVVTVPGATMNILLEDCRAEVDITTDSSTSSRVVGGLIGHVNPQGVGGGSFIVKRCSVVGSLGVRSSNSGGMCGGLIGRLDGNANNYNAITESYFTGNIIGPYYVAGAIASNGISFTSGTISNNYCVANITSAGTTSYMSGFIANKPTTILSQNYCVSSLSIATVSNNYGGFCNNMTSCVKCYYDSTVANRTDKNGNSIPRTTAELKAALPDGFGDTFWAIDPDGIINDGYPYLINNPPR